MSDDIVHYPIPRFRARLCVPNRIDPKICFLFLLGISAVVAVPATTRAQTVPDMTPERVEPSIAPALQGGDPTELQAPAILSNSTQAWDARETDVAPIIEEAAPSGWWRQVADVPAKWRYTGLGLAAASALYFGCRRGPKAYRKSILWFDAKAMGVRQIITIDDVDESDILTPAAVHLRGWSLDLMEKLLGPPDYAVIDPMGRDEPLILLSRKRVEALEASDQFKAYQVMRNLQATASASRISKWILLQEGYARFTQPAGESAS